MGFRPITPARLVVELAEVGYRLRPHGWASILVDGAPAAAPGDLADQVAAALAERGRQVCRVSATDFLRPASLRLERGREDPDSYFETWLDEPALRREVLDPLAPGGTGIVLPRLWNPVTDRSYRDQRTTLRCPAVLLVDGPLLLGRGLRLDLTVHLAVSGGALARRTAAELRWTLPAFARYAEQVGPELVADVVVRYDHPAHPAVSLPAAASG